MDIREATKNLIKKSYSDINTAVSEQILFGTITAITPKIKVKIENKYEVEEGQNLIVSKVCKTYLEEENNLLFDSIIASIEGTLNVLDNISATSYYSVTVITEPSKSQAHSQLEQTKTLLNNYKQIVLNKRLKVGDKVRLLSLNNNKILYMLERGD